MGVVNTCVPIESLSLVPSPLLARKLIFVGGAGHETKSSSVRSINILNDYVLEMIDFENPYIGIENELIIIMTKTTGLR